MQTTRQAAEHQIAALFRGVAIVVKPFGDRWEAACELPGHLLLLTLAFSHDLADLVESCRCRREHLWARINAERGMSDHVLGGEPVKVGSERTTMDMVIVEKA